MLSKDFLDKYPDFPKYNNILGLFVFLRCVTIDTKILCDDLVWRNAGDLVEGQGIIGFDEFPTANGRRYIRTGYVTSNSIKKSPVVGVELEDGTVVYATKDHPWLVKIGTDSQHQWRVSEELLTSDRGKDVFLVRPFGKPWEIDQTYVAGYLAAAFDGEGSLDCLNGLAFVQVENAMLARVEAFLNQYKIPYSKKIKANYGEIGKQDCYQLTVYGKETLFNLLGRIQTARIQHKFISKLNEMSDSDTGMQLYTSSNNTIKVVRVFDAGEKDIAVLGTNIKTHFTDGFASHNTYSRWLGDRWETWKEVCERVVNYSFSLYQGPYTDHKEEAESLFDAMFHMRVFPAGRTLWIGGTEAARKHPLANFNCSFAICDDFETITELMYLLMIGAGTGFRVLPEDVAKLPNVNTGVVAAHKPYHAKNPQDRIEETQTYVSDGSTYIIVGDSKNGWVGALRSYFNAIQQKDMESIIFNYDSVRPEGEPLKTFGGYASGHTALKTMFSRIHTVIKNGTERLTPIQVLDIVNSIGAAIVVGGTRRTAQIALFDVNDKDMLSAKNGIWGMDSSNYGKFWRGSSNNSIMFKEKPTKEQLIEVFKNISMGAEPGFVNLQAMQARRPNANGLNPCCEIILDDKGLCNLTEVNVAACVENGKFNWDLLTDALRHAIHMGMRMTNITIELPEWDKVQKRDRLLGVSLTGVMDAFDRIGETNYDAFLTLLKEFALSFVDSYAYEMRIPVPLLALTIKPSGTVSQLPTVSSGVHRSFAPYYIRRVRISSASPLAKVMLHLKYPIYPEGSIMLPKNFDNLSEYDRMRVLNESSTWVIEFPVATGANKAAYDETALEQFQRYLLFQNNWTDHNTSITISYAEHEVDALIDAILENWDNYVGISFIPKDNTIYPLMPYEAITETEFNRRSAALRHVTNDIITTHLHEHSYVYTDDLDADCSNGVCPVR